MRTEIFNISFTFIDVNLPLTDLYLP